MEKKEQEKEKKNQLQQINKSKFNDFGTEGKQYLEYNTTDIQYLLEYEMVQLYYLDINKYGYYHHDTSDYSYYRQFQNDTPRNTPFLFEKFVDSNSKYVQGIYKGMAVDMEKNSQLLKGSKNPWDFTPQNADNCPYKEVWVRETIDIDDLSLIKDDKAYDEEYLQELKQEIYSDPFIKITSDRDFHYGDGGQCRHVTPLYYTEQLNIKEKARQVLKKLLNEQADKTKDFHETCPVQDIVDPELNPNYSTTIPDHFSYKMPIKQEKYNGWRYKEDSLNENKFKNKYEEGLPQTQKNNEYVSLRSQYQWIPTKFLINKDKKVKILGQIHNLPRENTEQSEILYKLIEHVFEKQLPAYEKLNLINFDSKGECILQVVFKAQKYIIQPGSTYSGKWHLEGKTENIVAAGVYYISIDKGFDQDQLQYKPLISYEPWYLSDRPFLQQYDIDIQQGSSLVFSNTLPHRFATLKNETKKPLERLFMNFFIVDPSKPIIDTEYTWLVQNFLPKNVSRNIANCIYEYIGFSFQQDLEKAKEKRRKVRENATKEVSGWGYIHYGNSGDVEFLDSFSANINYGQRFDRVETQQEEQKQQE